MIASRSAAWTARRRPEALPSSPFAFIISCPRAAAAGMAVRPGTEGTIPSGDRVLEAAARRMVPEKAGIGLCAGPLIAANARGPEAERDQAFGELHRRRDTIHHRYAVFGGERGGEVRHTGAAEHDRFGA